MKLIRITNWRTHFVIPNDVSKLLVSDGVSDKRKLGAAILAYAILRHFRFNVNACAATKR